ncbi:MAG: hypothetical protein IH984_10685 [Planctomycetes bacterium]|nr:hypothetical protein [Planctomycetota bacterium]
MSLIGILPGKLASKNLRTSVGDLAASVFNKDNLMGLSHIGIGTVGFFLVVIILNIGSGPYHWVKTVRKKAEVRTYALFSPSNQLQEKHVLLSSCFTINNIAYNRPGEPRTLSRHGSAYLGQVMSFVLREEYDESNIGIYDMGSAATGNTDHLFYLAHILEAKNVKSIIYSNEPNGLYNFPGNRSHVSLDAIIILEHWREKYPQIAPNIDQYLASLYRSIAYFKAIRDYLKEHATTKTYNAFRKRSPPYNQPTEHRGWMGELMPEGYPDGLVEPRSLMVRRALNRGAVFRDLAVRSFSRIQSAEDENWDEMIIKSLDTAAVTYFREDLDGPLLMKYADWELALEGKDLPERKRTIFNYADTIEWFHILGGVCQAEGIQLVVWFPPDLSISDEHYHKTYKPRFVEKMKEILDPYGAIFIDHTIDHNINPYDIYWVQNLPYKKGHHSNIVGTLKKGRLLLGELIRHGVIEVQRIEDAVAWKGEANLPDFEFEVEVYVEEASDEEGATTQPARLTEGTN